jgi:glyoxylase-like metal-dependent hydrolase (beta-lactamase superfamily II)
VPHGTITIGEVEVTALCDAVREGPWTLAEAFPNVPGDDWPQITSMHPETAGPDGMWRAHDHSYLIRTDGDLILVDTGIGPAGTPVADVLHPEGGALLDELTAAAVQPADIDVVVLTHIHFDHIGWNVAGPADDPRPTFLEATYLIQRSEWDAYTGDDDPQGKPARDRQIRWLREAGLLRLVEGEDDLAEEIRLMPTPGHTPGSQSVLIGSGEGASILAGDVANHPIQVERPELRAFADADPALATATRREVFGRCERERLTLSTAHFADPFGRVVDGAWRPNA